MLRHYHIITCDNKDTLEQFISQGAVGIRPVISDSIHGSVRMNWDIMADLARVKKGDYIFLHTTGIIKGVFEVIDNPLVDDKNFFDGPTLSKNTWEQNIDVIKQTISKNPFQWSIPIVPLKEYYFKEISMDIIFNSIAKGTITSLPQRLRYEDKNKTIKGITKRDFDIVLGLFRNYGEIEITIQNSQIKSASYINFDYLTDDEYEKNLEAVVVHKIRSGTFSIRDINFSHYQVLNTVPLGYLKMADLLTWSERESIVINPWIWELKRDRLSYDGLKEEIKKLAVRASFINSLLNNGYKITGAFLLKDCLDLSFDLILPIGLIEEILIIRYSGNMSNVNFELIKRFK